LGKIANRKRYEGRVAYLPADDDPTRLAGRCRGTLAQCRECSRASDDDVVDGGGGVDVVVDTQKRRVRKKKGSGVEENDDAGELKKSKRKTKSTKETNDDNNNNKNNNDDDDDNDDDNDDKTNDDTTQALANQGSRTGAAVELPSVLPDSTFDFDKPSGGWIVDKCVVVVVVVVFGFVCDLLRL
jgi:hypothetical protein